MFQEWKKDLNEVEKAILNYAYNYWKEKLEWPKSVELEVKCMDKFKENEDLFGIMYKLKDTFILFDNPNDNEGLTRLSIFGMALCDNSEADIDIFLQIVSYLTKRYIKNPVKPDFTSEEVQEHFDFDQEDIKRIKYLIFTANDLFAGYNNDYSSFKLNSRAWKFKNVKTIDEYFKKTGRRTPERFLKIEEEFNKIGQNKVGGIEFRTSEKNNICFVISPIGEKGSKDYDKFKKVLDLIIKPAIKYSGYELKVLRADEIRKPGSWINDILNNLFSSFIVIADLTDQNPNVFYELGVRHSLSPRTILIAQSIDEIPSDLRSYRTIIYEMSLEGPHQFKKDLSLCLEEIFQDPNRPDNPVLDNLGTIRESQISRLENENIQLRNEIRKKDPNLSKIEEKISEESINTRLDRIFKIRRIYVWDVSNLPNNQGNFTAYRDFSKRERNEILYVATNSSYKKEDYLIDISDIRVIMELISNRPNLELNFIIATNSNLSKEKESIFDLFNRAKSFIKDEVRDLYKLEIWDKNVILKKERELGIKFD